MNSMNELSETLRSERLSQGLSLRAVSEQALVSVEMLELLERGEYRQIGTSLLIRNFIRAYCSVLGIDPDPLLEKYAAEIHACDVQDRGIQKHRNVVKALQRKRRIGVLPVLFLLIATAGGIYGGTWLWKRYERQSLEQNVHTGVYVQQELPSDLPESQKEVEGNPSTVPGVTAPKVESKSQVIPDDGRRVSGTEPAPAAQRAAEEISVNKPSVVAASPSEVLPEETPVAAAHENGKQHRFAVEAHQETWVRVAVDGKNAQDVLLRPGDKREWEADERVQVVIGNAGGVRMMWDGEPLGFSAKPGTVLRFKLPGDNR